MAAGQIDHMDIITHTGAVGRGIIVAVHVHHGQLAHGHLGNVGAQVVGNAVGILADQAGFVRTDGVEVAQKGHIQRGIGLAHIFQNALGESLGGAIGVGGAAHGEILTDGHTGRIAIHRCAGGEHKVFAVITAHHIQNVQGAVEVVGIIFNGLGNAFAHSLIGRKLDHRINIGVFGKDLFHLCLIRHVGFHKTEVFACDLLYTAHSLGAGIVKVIRHHNVIPGCEQLNAGVAANIAGAAAYQNCHNAHSHLKFV